MTTQIPTPARRRPVPPAAFPALALALALALPLALGACADTGQEEEGTRLPAGYQVADDYAAALDVDLDDMQRRSTGLYVQDIVEGEGARADSGDVVTVHYTGWLPQGSEFDSSRDRAPFEVAIGYGRVIQGWDHGVVGMKVGGQRRLVIPPALAYGESGRGSIPPNSTLVFDIELLDVENRTPEGGTAGDTTAVDPTGAADAAP